MSVRIERESQERLETTVHTTSDPTSGAVEFAFTDPADRPTTWTAGTWAGLAAGGWTAQTPLIGAGALDLAPGRWIAWIRLHIGGETPVIRLGQVDIT